jgi:hypothetical protein
MNGRVVIYLSVGIKAPRLKGFFEKDMMNDAQEQEF